MKRFKKYLEEELNMDQQFYVDQMMDLDGPQTRTTEFSDHLFDEKNLPKGGKILDGGNTIVFDLPKDRISFKPPKHIEDHLNILGYDIHDYEKGLAIRRGGDRPISIGKVLSREIPQPETPYNAHDPKWQDWQHLTYKQKAILDDYNKCDVRAAMRTPLQILISRDTYKVAEMSSNKPRWISCLALGTCPSRDLGDDDWGDEELEKGERPYHERPGYQAPGQNARRIAGEIKSGSHIAYLIPAGDHGLKNPFARVLLKPYHSESIDSNISKLPLQSQMYGWSWDQIKPQHTILRSSPATYTSQSLHMDDVRSGRSQDSIVGTFRNTVDEIIKSHFPMKHDQYHLDPLSYWDRQEIGTKTREDDNENFRI